MKRWSRIRSTVTGYLYIYEDDSSFSFIIMCFFEDKGKGV